MLNLIVIWLVILTIGIFGLTVRFILFSKDYQQYKEKNATGSLGVYILKPNPEPGEIVWISSLKQQDRIMKGEKGTEFLLQTKYMLDGEIPYWKTIRVMHNWNETIDFLQARRPAGSSIRLKSG